MSLPWRDSRGPIRDVERAERGCAQLKCKSSLPRQSWCHSQEVTGGCHVPAGTTCCGAVRDFYRSRSICRRNASSCRGSDVSDLGHPVGRAPLRWDAYRHRDQVLLHRLSHGDRPGRGSRADLSSDPVFHRGGDERVRKSRGQGRAAKRTSDHVDVRLGLAAFQHAIRPRHVQRQHQFRAGAAVS
jgi:hypothetical protein